MTRPSLPPGSRGRAIHDAAIAQACPRCGAFGGEWCVTVRSYRVGYGRGARQTESGHPATYLHTPRWHLGREAVERDEAAARAAGGTP